MNRYFFLGGGGVFLVLGIIIIVDFVDFDFWSLIVFLCGGEEGKSDVGNFLFYFWVLFYFYFCCC